MDPVSAIGLAVKRVPMHHRYYVYTLLLLASIITVVDLTVAVIRVCQDYPSGSADRLRIVNALEDRLSTGRSGPARALALRR